MIEFITILLLGTIYGLIIGIVPTAGATTGLIIIFSFLHLFPDPYLAVVFCMATVGASTTGDSYAGVLLGIPGANSAATTMLDGHPLAKQGKANLALSTAIISSTVNGLIWGCLTFLLIPYYKNIVLYMGIPELWGFTILAFVCVVFISSKWWVRGLIALAFGVWLGMIGINPYDASDRFTFGWYYLADSVQIVPVAVGLFAIPEMIAGLKYGKISNNSFSNNNNQTKEAFIECWRNRWLSLRGGMIGAVIGLLPALGGSISDWIAYGQTVATNPNEKIPFGKGNIKGVIGPEGANNSQKATSMIPTMLFGIPGAKFAAMLIALFAYLNFDLGTPELLEDEKFIFSLTFGFLCSTILVCFICLLFNKQIARVTEIPFAWYFPILLFLVVWTAVQYTGGWEDYAILGIMTTIGMLCKHYKFSRPALLIGFILSERIEGLTLQVTTIYDINSLITRPMFIALCIAIVSVLIFGLNKRTKLEYA